MPPRKPPHVVCYICGRLYGTTSISLHIPKCMEKWEMENAQLPRSLRRKPPRRPTGWGDTPLSSDPRERGAQLDVMNDLAFQASQSQLVPCENCGRTFNPDRLPVHQRSCRPNNPLKLSKNFDPSRASSGGQRPSPLGDYRRRSPQPPNKPKTVVCFICGREFGTKSISIHEPQCMKKWEIENSRLPKHLRRPQPVKPSILPSLSCHSGDDVERMNQLAFESSQRQLVQCMNCGRTFLPDRLDIHLRSCKPGSKRIQSMRSGHKLSPLNTLEGLGNTYSGQHGSRSPLGQYDRYSHNSQNIEPLMKDKTFIKSKSPSGEKKSTSSIASIQRPARLQPMSNGRTQSPSFNFGLNSPMPQSQLTDMKTHGGNLVPCQNCGRSFASDRLSKHQSICRKTTGKQRKVFDSSRMRTQGTDAAKYNRAGARRAHDAIKPKTNWRQKHAEFINAIRDAKRVTEHMKRGGKASDLPPPVPSENPDYVFCRFCTRRFAPDVAERHIPKCQTTVNRPAPPKQRALQIRGSARHATNVPSRGRHHR